MAEENVNISSTLLEPMSFPLHGARLIEASAGTGKTFTIASLYLRLLLGHGDEKSAHSAPLSVEEILVVTFTEAATAELKGRIRQRIHEARLAFMRGESKDPAIAPLLSSFSDHSSAARILLDAERNMDSAAIYTIHGFCQRMLVQNAFESGARFENEFITDETRLKSQIVADYWRRFFYPLSKDVAYLVRQYWPTPNELYQQIHRYLSGKAAKLSSLPLQGEIEQIHLENIDTIEEMKQAWREQSADAILALEQALDQKVLDRRSYSSKNFANWINKVSDWATQETKNYTVVDELVRFSYATLSEKTKSGVTPSHPLFHQIEAFLATPITLKSPLLAHAIEECRLLLSQAKEQKQWLSFDDLLVQLSSALDLDIDDRLALRIRQLYPVAMIDEFQDTDPLQYSIFSRIYLPNPQCGLFMIGDPKQAIYAFRGADIFTYIQARNQVVDHYTLGTNWRSSGNVINAVNTLFSSSPAPFIYKNDIPFHPVSCSPNGMSRKWTLNGKEQPAMTLWNSGHEQLCSRSEYTSSMATSTAAQIQLILTQSQNNQAKLITGKGEESIEPQNIAVLVRTGNEGKLIKRALSQQGVASVYLSNQDSVFTTAVAQDVLRILQAVHLPDNERFIRAALASASFNLPLSELDELNFNESAWERVNYEFRHYHELWKRRGVLPMLRSILIQRSLAQHWLAQDEGERNLTDFLHLGELLQNASIELESDVALIRWLSQSIDDATQGMGNSDEHILRLESEQKLVQIVTIHKSKGLEYDLVFVPFAMNYIEAMEAKYHDEMLNDTVLDLDAQSESKSLADKERLAEDLRLLYVAVTRAVYACYLGAEPVMKPRAKKRDGDSSAHLSALGYLLQQGKTGNAEFFNHCLNRFAYGTESCVVATPLQVSSERYIPASQDTDDLHYAQLNNQIDKTWRMTSYSSLVKQGHGQHHLSVELERPGFDVDSAEDIDDQQPQEPEKSIFTFPRGAKPGTFLHSLFEQIEFHSPITEEPNHSTLLKLIEDEQLDSEWESVLIQLVNDVLKTPLNGKKMKLQELQPQQKLVEMEFLLPIDVLNAPNLNRIISRHDSLSARAEALGFSPIQGMLKGFVDLVFEYQGRYYILDWKSNYLGDRVEDYAPDRLNRAMIEHRYDLQYQLYTLALHRFLGTRIPDYDYQTHFGGVYYLFLRGMDGVSQHGVFKTKPSEELVLALNAWINGEDNIEQQSSQMELGL